MRLAQALQQGGLLTLAQTAQTAALGNLELLHDLLSLGLAVAGKVMKELQIAESRRLRGLGERQQVALLERLG